MFVQPPENKDAELCFAQDQLTKYLRQMRGLTVSTLQQELQIYEEVLPSLLKTHMGEYVVIRGNTVQHFEKTYEAALNWAYQQFGLDQFFVKQVDSEKCVAHFTRDLGPCIR